MLHLFSFIVWRTWSYCLCMLARLWVLMWMSAVCWCCCCDAGGSSYGAGWSLRRTSARSSAMTFFAFKRCLSRFLTTSSLFRTRLASSSASFSRSSSNAVSTDSWPTVSRQVFWGALLHNYWYLSIKTPWFPVYHSCEGDLSDKWPSPGTDEVAFLRVSLKIKHLYFSELFYFLNTTIWLISWGGRFSNLVTGKLNVTKKIVIINNKWMCYFSIVGMASFVMN